MNFRRLLYKTALLVAVATLFNACEKDDDTDPKVTVTKATGFYITNEGAFGNSNSELSFFNYSENSITNNLFKTVNNRPLGDVLQSMTIFGNKGYLVLNNSSKVEVVKLPSLKEAGVITGLVAPRYITTLPNGKIAVSEWNTQGSVSIIDTNTLSVVKSIPVGTGPEKMVVKGNYLLVANGGGFAVDSTVSVIDLTTLTEVRKIKVGYNPKDIEIDNNGTVWVLSYGYVTYDMITWETIHLKPSALSSLSSDLTSVTATVKIADQTHPQYLECSADKKTLFYGGGYGFQGIFKFNPTTKIIDSTPVIDKAFYGFAINPVTNEIVGTEAPSFTLPGTVYRYTNTGVEIASYSTGIGPNNILFVTVQE